MSDNYDKFKNDPLARLKDEPAGPGVADEKTPAAISNKSFTIPPVDPSLEGGNN